MSLWSSKSLHHGGTNVAALFLATLVLFPAGLAGGALPDNRWQVLAISYPDRRTVEVSLGGSAKTLTSVGEAKVKWRAGKAQVELRVEALPAPASLSWPDRQYVLWAIDNEKRAINLGTVPLRGTKAEWRVEVPLRTFGLLVTAEKNAQAQQPGDAVVLESLLPRDTTLVVPVFQVNVTLAATAG